ncbi:E3 binding domain-containing protein [Streptomyces sp. NPDC001123]
MPAEAITALGAGPLVRHLAELRGVDLTTLQGIGPGGRITRADVQHAPPPHMPGVRSTPYARRLAHDLDVDLAETRGSGDGGAARAADVRADAGEGERERPRPHGGRRTPVAVLPVHHRRRAACRASTAGSAP